jgi:hypothetical protein
MFLGTWISQYINGFGSMATILAQKLGPNTIGTVIIPLYLYVKKKKLRQFIYETISDVFQQ